MTTKHTNGKWIVNDKEVLGLYIDTPEQDRICEVWDDSREGVSQANARLIAAAPELLEALEACLTMDGATAERSHTMALTRLRAINEIATAALKAAKGE